jgi:hypothetical protein
MVRRRRPTVVNRRARPGLLGTAARTAVIAGTATATAGVVSHAMNKGKAPSPSQQQDSVEAHQQAEIEQPQSEMAGMQTSALSAPGQTPSASSQGRISQLKELAQLKEAGVLTEEEFQHEKARILSS